ncbi:MAG: hypothetical protein HYT34_02195, partial [Candidatus Ryanbacteria bacterium]|nr:hypothetical protein [Candidatus Ryanbacteria bacterium]
DATFILVIQVNGRLRDSAEAPVAISEEEARSLVFSRPKIKKYMAGKEPKKIIFVPRRLINIVL